jgi:stromal membrane-associated protein
VKPAQPASFDLIGGDDVISPPVRPSTTDPPAASRPPPPKQQQPSQLLGGLDFLGAPPDRPSSATSKPAGMSRPDLKQSILSLYASTPKPQPQQSVQPQHARQTSFGMQPAAKSSAFSDLNDAFGGLSFGSTASAPPSTQAQTQQQPQQPSGFPSFTPSSNKAAPAPPQISSPPTIVQPPLAGGGFFDAGPKPPPKPAAPKAVAPPPLAVRKVSNASDGFGEFSSAFNPSAPNTAPITASSIANSTNGLLDLSNPPSAINSARPANPSQPNPSIFNLSAPKAPGNYNAVLQSSAPATKTTFKNTSTDPWGSNEWNTNEPAVATPQTGLSVASPSLKSATGADFGWGSSPLPTNKTTPSAIQSEWSKPAATQSSWSNIAAPGGQSEWGNSNDTGGWGDPTPPASTTLGGFGSAPAPPKITAEEDFGDWGSAPAPTTAPVPAATSSTGSKVPTAAPKLSDNDLWGNVWE